MTQKPGRNDPCRCGSGKKYKNCCLTKDLASSAPLGTKKFTAKVISAGGTHQAQQTAQEQEKAASVKAFADYDTLMKRSFGEAITNEDETPPSLANSDEFLPKKDENS